MSKEIYTRAITFREYREIKHDLHYSIAPINAFYNNPRIDEPITVYNEETGNYVQVDKNGKIIKNNKKDSIITYPVINIDNNLTYEEFWDIIHNVYFHIIKPYEKYSNEYYTLTQECNIKNPKTFTVGTGDEEIKLVNLRDCLKPADPKPFSYYSNFHLFKKYELSFKSDYNLLFYTTRLVWLQHDNILVSTLPFSPDVQLPINSNTINTITVALNYNKESQKKEDTFAEKLYSLAADSNEKSNCYVQKDANDINNYKTINLKDKTTLNLHELSNIPIVIDSTEKFLYKELFPFHSASIYVKPAWYNKLIERCKRNPNLVTPIIFDNFEAADNDTKRVITDIITTGIIPGNYFLPPNCVVILKHNNKKLVNFLSNYKSFSIGMNKDNEYTNLYNTNEDFKGYLSIVYSPNKTLPETSLIDSFIIEGQDDNYITLTTGLYTIKIPQNNEEFKEYKTGNRKEIDLEFERTRKINHFKNIKN